MLSGLIVLSLLGLLAVAALAATVRDLLTDGYRRQPSRHTPVRPARMRRPRPPRRRLGELSAAGSR